jgi:hypothetical protein
MIYHISKMSNGIDMGADISDNQDIVSNRFSVMVSGAWLAKELGRTSICGRSLS